VAASAPATTPIVKIAIFGDDQQEGIYVGSGMPQTVTPNEAAQLQSLLQAKFNDAGITVEDISSGGTSSSLMNELDGMDGLGVGQPQRMEQSEAQIVIEAHMLNDALGGETVADYTGYLIQQVQNAKGAGVILIFEEDSPVCDGDHPQLAAYVAAMDAVASQYNVPLIRQYSSTQAIGGWRNHMLGCLVPDPTLTAVKSQAELAVIAPIVKSLVSG
jgi:hypothetical protein